MPSAFAAEVSAGFLNIVPSTSNETSENAERGSETLHFRGVGFYSLAKVSLELRLSFATRSIFSPFLERRLDPSTSRCPVGGRTSSGGSRLFNVFRDCLRADIHLSGAVLVKERWGHFDLNESFLKSLSNRLCQVNSLKLYPLAP